MSSLNSVKSQRFSLNSHIDGFCENTLDLFLPSNTKHWAEKLLELWVREQEAFCDKTDATKKLYSSKYRNALKSMIANNPDLTDRRKEWIETEVLKIVRLDEETMSKVNKEYRERRLNRNVDLISVPDTQWKELVEDCRGLLKLNDPAFKALGLMALTGRRFIEVMQSGSFDYVIEDKSAGQVKQKYMVKFSGQAKTRGAPGTKFGEEYIIPVLAPAPEIIRAFNELRQSREGKLWLSSTPRELNSNTNLNTRMNKLFHGLLTLPQQEMLTLSSLRSLYAEIAYKAFGKKTAKSVFFAKILGHKEDDYQSTLSYMVFTLGDDDAKQHDMAEVQRLVMEFEKQPAREDPSNSD